MKRLYIGLIIMTMSISSLSAQGYIRDMSGNKMFLMLADGRVISADGKRLEMTMDYSDNSFRIKGALIASVTEMMEYVDSKNKYLGALREDIVIGADGTIIGRMIPGKKAEETIFLNSKGIQIAYCDGNYGAFPIFPVYLIYFYKK